MHISAEPLVPFALWLSLAIAALSVMAWYARTYRFVGSQTRKFAIVALMTVSLMLPLVVLLNPTLIRSIPPPAGKPVLNIVVDNTASMDAIDVNQESRFVAAQKIAKTLVGEMADDFEIKLSVFGNASKAIANVAELASFAKRDKRTNISTAIQDSIKDVAPQGQAMLLISDGIHNANNVVNVIENARRAQAMNVPVYTLTLGGEVGVKNVSVQLRSRQELAFIDQTVPVVVNVVTRGLPTAELMVSIWKDEQKVDEARIRVDGTSHAGEATFDLVEDKTGLYRYQVRVDEVSGEATFFDNRATMLLRVVDQPVRVLLLEGKPYWDTKFLIRKLAADQSIRLTSLVRMAEDRILERVVDRVKNGDGISSLESTRILKNLDETFSPDALKKTRVLILGRDAEVFLTDEVLETVRNWISRDGGSLVCSRGAPSAQVTQRLATILPVSWTNTREQRFRVRLTNMGRDLRWLSSLDQQDDLLETMPTLASTASPKARAGLSNVLVSTGGAQDDSSPVVSFQPYGVGRTIVVEGAGMWRWALLAPKHGEHEQVYATLWRNLLRWLVSRSGLLPGQNVSLQADRVNFETGTVATATLLVRDGSSAQTPVIELKTPGKEIREYVARPGGQDPGMFRVEFPDLPAGWYSVEAVSHAADGTRKVLSSTAFDVQESWIESLELDARDDLMNRIASETGGLAISPDDPISIAAQFRDHIETLHPKRVRREQIWDRWWFLLAAFGLWTISWIVRRKSGLV